MLHSYNFALGTISCSWNPSTATIYLDPRDGSQSNLYPVVTPWILMSWLFDQLEFQSSEYLCEAYMLEACVTGGLLKSQLLLSWL